MFNQAGQSVRNGMILKKKYWKIASPSTMYYEKRYFVYFKGNQYFSNLSNR